MFWGSRLCTPLLPQILTPHWHPPDGDGFSNSTSLLRGRAHSCFGPDGTWSWSCLEACRCGINSFANEQLLPELALECLCFSLGGKCCVVCLFPNCGSRLPADLGRQFYHCSHLIILTSLGKRNTNNTIFALKSEISDHMCTTQDIPPPTQPWCTCPQVRSGFLHSTELVPDLAVAPSDLSQQYWFTVLLGIWRADGNSFCSLSQEDWEGHVASSMACPCFQLAPCCNLLYWISSFVKPE